MKNFVQEGERINYTNATGSDIASGDVVVIGNLVGIAVTDIADASTGAVALEGVYSLTKETPLAISQGDELFWSVANNEVTKTATDKPIGVAFAGAGSADTTVDVKIYGQGNGIPAAATVAAVTTADGSDPATTQALANQLKTTVNDILTSIKAAGLMA